VNSTKRCIHTFAQVTALSRRPDSNREPLDYKASAMCPTRPLPAPTATRSPPVTTIPQQAPAFDATKDVTATMILEGTRVSAVPRQHTAKMTEI
jgi:hypothetical protein